MINLFAFLNRKRSYIFAFAFVAVASVVLAGSPPQDPLDAPMIQFEKTVEDAFHGKKAEGSEKNELLNLLHNPDKAEKDITLPMGSAELAALEKQYGTMKGLIETASKSRQDLEQNDERLKSLARYAARYFTAQKRIYFNFMRNVHRVAGEEYKYDPTTYDSLDLNLQGNAGMELIYLADEAKTGEGAFKDSQGNVVSLLLNYNVRHVRGFLDRFNLSQLYMTRADKDELELQAIQDIVSQKNYNKIIAFMTTRTRIGNYWALQRMNSATKLADPDLASCGKNFLSFRDLPKNGTNYVPGASYFNSLKNEDRYNEFNKKLEKGLSEKSLNAPLLSADAMSRVIQNYYSKLPDPDGLDVKMKVQADPDSYSSEAYIQNLLTRAEDLWKTQSATGLKLAGYIGDNWDDASEIADRFAWTVFEQRRVLLINQIVSETDGSFEESDNADQKAKKKVKSLIDSLKGTDEEKHRQLREWAKAAVDSELNVQAELAWRANMKKLVVEYYKSPTSIEIDNGFRSDRLDEVLGDTWNGIQNAVYSKFVESKVDGIKDQATSCLKAYGHYFTIDTTSDKCKYVKDIKDTLGLGERDIDSVDFAKTDSFSAFLASNRSSNDLAATDDSRSIEHLFVQKTRVLGQRPK